jgi:hypothetical protein
MWGMGLFWLLVIIVLVLSAAGSGLRFGRVNQRPPVPQGEAEFLLRVRYQPAGRTAVERQKAAMVRPWPRLPFQCSKRLCEPLPLPRNDGSQRPREDLLLHL